MRSSRPFLALAAFLSAYGVTAAEDAYPLRPGGADFYWSSTTTAVDIAGVEHDLDNSRLVIDYSEAANEWLYLGFGVGLSFNNAETAPLVAATDPAGYSFSVYSGVRFLERGGFALNAEGRYLRDYSEGEDDLGSTATLKYAEVTGKLGASYRWQALELTAGVYSLRLTGDVESVGTVVGSADIAEMEQSGAYGGARLRIDGGYALGVRVESGARDSLTFSFTSRF